ncbi:MULTISPECIES: type VII secretion protein EccB [unclassified Micromonospora]|uniref:type VII secretion protein EccB n=1 Tax=unclassified Micromonospora TaxID=2617518 RepID=UPI003A8862E4
MATRRDQLHSYQFLTQRVISAFVMREPDPQQSPLRRGVGAIFGGLMIAVLVAAGFGIYGIMTKADSDRWQADGAVVIEKETGASFIYLQGKLHPTLNYASAVLASGRPDAPVFRVPGNSLASTPRGVTIGIPGAPNSLAPASRNLGLPWTICSAPSGDDTGRTVETVSLVVSRAPVGGRSLAEEGVLVRDSRQDTTHLVWHGRRFLIRDARNVVPALFGEVDAAPVGAAWLNALPAGNAIERVAFSGRNQPSGEVDGWAIGDVLATQTGSGPQYYLVLDDGLAPITELQQNILRAEFTVEPVEIPVSQATSAPISSQVRPAAGDSAPPATPPTLIRPATGDALCAVTSDARAVPTITSVGGTVAGLDEAVPTGSVTRAGVILADYVLVPPGRVAVVRVIGAPTADPGPYYVVTDLGIKFPVLNATVLGQLGYSADQATDVPTTLVSRIPTGPTLDPVAATRPASGAPAD